MASPTVSEKEEGAGWDPGGWRVVTPTAPTAGPTGGTLLDAPPTRFEALMPGCVPTAGLLVSRCEGGLWMEL